jgi:Mannosyl-glycoprotein endo-beta-N-acetylglucosaminidase
MKKLFFVGLLNLLIVAAFAQSQEQINAYVESHKNIAIAEMNRTGVPASITLAQGILETSAGTSPLYLRSNNNFGIKCKSNWNGKFTYHDDDAKGECFRVYENDSLSYVDHSNFLKSSSRYDFLFAYEKTDYKSWAIGLKKAGYATNPQYSAMLIKYIEQNNLQQFDNAPTEKVASNFHSNVMVNGVAINSKKTSMQSTSFQKADADLNMKQVEESTSPSSNLPSDNSNAADDNSYPVVHWQVSNVSDATNGYTVTPVYRANATRYHVANSKTKYGRAKVSHVAASTKNSKQVALKTKQGKHLQTNITKSKTAVAAKKSTNKNYSAIHHSTKKSGAAVAKLGVQ